MKQFEKCWSGAIWPVFKKSEAQMMGTFGKNETKTGYSKSTTAADRNQERKIEDEIESSKRNTYSSMD